MKNVISILIIALFVSSCHQKQSVEYIADNIVMEEEMTPPITKQEHNTPKSPIPIVEVKEIIKKKIIKDGRIGVEVNDLEKTKSNIDLLIAKHQGYYASEKLNNSSRETSYSLKIRVPSKNFEKLIRGIELGGGEIKYKEIDARDVTDQFIDIETRLKNKKNYLSKYNDLLKKAKSIKDILEIEEKIRGIEEEIESTTGILKYLGDLVDYSTLNLQITKQKDYRYQPQKRTKFVTRIINALSKGWYGFVDFIVFIIRLWPFWIIAILIIYGLRNYKKRMKKKTKS